jgi:hypothetical protein
MPTPSAESLALSAELSSRDNIPWKGVKVFINKQFHQRKGELAIVTDVLCNQDTPSGLKVQVTFTGFNPSISIPTDLLDYDDVIEYRYEVSLQTV